MYLSKVCRHLDGPSVISERFRRHITLTYWNTSTLDPYFPRSASIFRHENKRETTQISTPVHSPTAGSRSHHRATCGRFSPRPAAAATVLPWRTRRVARAHVAGHLEPESQVLSAECDTPHLLAKSLCEPAQPLVMNRSMVRARLSRNVHARAYASGKPAGSTSGQSGKASLGGTAQQARQGRRQAAFSSALHAQRTQRSPARW